MIIMMSVARTFYRTLSTTKARLCAVTDGINHAERTTTFGFETVSEEEKKRRVEKVFSQVARHYDVMNDAMSLGIHWCWKDYFIKKLHPTPDTKLLDVAGGTGDIAFRFMDYRPLGKREVTICDLNAKMLRHGQKKAAKQGYTRGITWIQGDATNLPFADNSFDAYTISFGLRNVSNLDQALQEAFRVLRPGGRFMCMEFSEVSNPLAARFFYWYNFDIIPVLGEVITGDREPYEYLVESILQFPNQEKLLQHIGGAGFHHTDYENLTFGLVAIHSAFKY